MTATPFDSAHLHRLFSPGDLGRLFSDSAEIRAGMIVLGTLAKVQGTAGLIPEVSAQAIHRASLELQIDPGGLAAATAVDGTPVPALVAAFRDLMQAPEHAQHLCHGVPPTDVADCALMLRLRQALSLCETELAALLQTLATTGDAAAIEACGWPLLVLREELTELRASGLPVALRMEGAPESAGPLRESLAAALNLHLPADGWPDTRTPLARIAGWTARRIAALAGRGQVAEAGDQGVSKAALVALDRHASALEGALATAPDGAAGRFQEWLALPQIMLSGGSALRHARALAETLAPGEATGDARRFASAVQASAVQGG